MPYCSHDRGETRPLRIRGYDTPQQVCAGCWRQAIRDEQVAG